MPSRREFLTAAGTTAGTILVADPVSAGASPDETWSRTYAPADGDVAQVHDVVPVGDGFVLVGVAGGFDEYRGWIAGVDAGGRVRWHRRRGTDRSAFHAGVPAAGDAEGIVAAGLTNLPTAHNEPERSNPYVTRVRSDGETPWLRTYRPGAVTARARAIVPLGEGYAIAGGASDGGSTRPWVAHVDAHGVRSWTWNAGRPGGINDAVGVADETVVCGSVWPPSSDSAPRGPEESAWIGALAADGNATWQWRHDGADGSRFEAVAPAPDGGVVAVGRRGVTGDTGGVGWLVAFDPDGRRRWDRTYSQDAWNWHRDLAVVDDGYVLVGSREEGPETDARGAWLLRVDADGRVAWEHQFSTGTRGFTVHSLADGGLLVGGDADAVEEDRMVAWLGKLGGDPAAGSSSDHLDLPSLPGWTVPFLAGGVLGASAAAYWRRS